jgi:CRP-like cAMP-binding protein
VDRARLQPFPLFSELDPEQLDAVASVATETEVEAGHELAVEGDFGHSLFAIEHGTADVSRDGEFVRTLGLGEIFGEVLVAERLAGQTS